MKGAAWVWAGTIGLVLFGTFFYIIFDHVKSSFESTLTTQINETNTTFSSGILSTIDILGTTWQWFLFIMLIGIVVWAFIQAQREKLPYE